MAERLSRHGCPLAIVDQDEQGLEETAERLATPVLARRLDVRDRQAQMSFAAEVAEWAPVPIGMVFNNAGVTATQSVAAGGPRRRRVGDRGQLRGRGQRRPRVLADPARQGSGVIVNTSSVFGLLGFPGQSAYCASKFAVRGFTDSLRQELRETGVRAINVHPGGVRTNIVRNARFHADPLGRYGTKDDLVAGFEAITMTTPERAAEIIHRGVNAGKSRILVGPDAYMFDALARIAPTHYYDVIRALEPLSARRARSRS